MSQASEAGGGASASASGSVGGSGTPLVYSPYEYAIHEDPYPVYRRMRAEAPLYRNEILDFWALSRYDDVLAGFRDPARLSNRLGVSLDESSRSPHAARIMSFLAMDPPRHTRMRGLVARGFTPRRVAALEPSIRALANHYLDRVQEAGSCEFIEDFAGRLPMDVVSEMLGVPEADRDTLRGWSDTIVHREEGMTDVPPAGIEASLALIAYFQEMVAERRQKPGRDLASALLDAELEGARLAPEDVVAFLYLMVIAGNETTTKLLANALYWLDLHPDQRDRVVDDPGRIPGWVEETLRFDNSSQAIARTVAEPVAFHGETLEPGACVLLLVGSANRDERHWQEPDRYDIGRNTTGSLSFGQGTHFCLGASLARLEARVSLEEIWRRMPGFTVDAGGAVRVHSSNVRGFARLPLEPGW